MLNQLMGLLYIGVIDIRKWHAIKQLKFRNQVETNSL